MATFWEIPAHSVDHMFSLYFDFVILVISRFGFEGWILVLIASVPGLYILFNFNCWLTRGQNTCLMHVFLCKSPSSSSTGDLLVLSTDLHK